MRTDAPAHNHWMHHAIPRLSVLLVLLGGCGVKLPGEDGSSSGEPGEASSGTLGNSSDPTTGGSAETGGPVETVASDTAPPPETSGTSTATSPPTTGDVTSDGDSGGFTVTTLVMTGGDETEGGLPSCAAMCQHEGECGLGDGEEACLATCEAGLDGAGQECVEVTGQLLACLTELSCEQLEAVIEDELGHPCNTEQLNVKTLCHPEQPDCDFGGGGDFEGNSCELEIWCPGDPERRMDCDKEQCICKLGGEVVATCPADGVCDDLKTLDDKGVSCCGFSQVDL